MSARLWHDLVSSQEAPYEIPLGVEEGATFQAAPPFPDLAVDQVHIAEVDKLYYQTLLTTATSENSDREQRIIIGRLMAVTTDGGEVEIQRHALPMEAIEKGVDVTRCAACGGNIPHGEARILEDAAYHANCLTED